MLGDDRQPDAMFDEIATACAEIRVVLNHGGQPVPANDPSKLLCASCQVVNGPGQYIARSDITGTSEVTVVDTAVLASLASPASTFTVNRALA